MLSQDRYNFRIAICSLILVGVVLLLTLLFAPPSNANVILKDPTAKQSRLSTPVEIAQAVLDGQVEALRKHGFNQQCLLSVEIQGERCIERCIPQDIGFFIAVGLDKPECQVLGCGCEGREMEMFPQEPIP